MFDVKRVSTFRYCIVLTHKLEVSGNDKHKSCHFNTIVCWYRHSRCTTGWTYRLNHTIVLRTVIAQWHNCAATIPQTEFALYTHASRDVHTSCSPNPSIKSTSNIDYLLILSVDPITPLTFNPELSLIEHSRQFFTFRGYSGVSPRLLTVTYFQPS